MRYLESRIISLVRHADRARLSNGTAPPPPPLPEPDIADMEFFLSQLQMILPVVGFNFAKPKPKLEPKQPTTGTAPLPGPVASEGDSSESPDLVMEKVGARAHGREVDGEFVVFSGSTARRQGLDSWTSYKTLREKLVSDRALVPADDPELLVFLEDVSFASRVLPRPWCTAEIGMGAWPGE